MSITQKAIDHNPTSYIHRIAKDIADETRRPFFDVKSDLEELWQKSKEEVMKGVKMRTIERPWAYVMSAFQQKVREYRNNTRVSNPHSKKDEVWKTYWDSGSTVWIGVDISSYENDAAEVVRSTYNTYGPFTAEEEYLWEVEYNFYALLEKIQEILPEPVYQLQSDLLYFSSHGLHDTSAMYIIDNAEHFDFFEVHVQLPEEQVREIALAINDWLHGKKNPWEEAGFGNAKEWMQFQALVDWVQRNLISRRENAEIVVTSFMQMKRVFIGDEAFDEIGDAARKLGSMAEGLHLQKLERRVRRELTNSLQATGGGVDYEWVREGFQSAEDLERFDIITMQLERQTKYKDSEIEQFLYELYEKEKRLFVELSQSAANESPGTGKFFENIVNQILEKDKGQ